jgi:UDP-GlcNAc:undecaprenyl-phosphate GlcNAc-1-phosphate transferase
MIESISAPLIAFFGTAGLIFGLRPLAIKLGLTDKPDQRKQHEGEIPLVGGIAIFVGVVLATVITGYGDLANNYHLQALFAACLLLVGIGAYDDLHEQPAVVRLAAQAGAALIMVYWGGTFLADVGGLAPNGDLVGLGRLAIPFTVFATIGIVNAINMCDGLDGLSGNLSLVTLLGFGIANSLWGGAGSLPLVNVFSAAIAGFLLFNQRMLWRSSAAVFLGDAGSMMLGLFLAWTCVESSQGPERILEPAAALWFLMIPIFDTVRVMLSRILRGRSPFEADAHHLHHLFVRTGHQVNETIAIICLLAAAGVGIGLLGSLYDASGFALAGSFLSAGIVYFLLLERSWRKMLFLGKAIQQR